MEPLIRDGDRVEVSPLTERNTGPAPGQVLLARSHSGALVCHRVLSQSATHLWLAGDHSSVVERHAADSILGIVTNIDRGGSVQRLGSRWTRPLDRLEARLHLVSIHRRRPWTGRAAEAIRRSILALRSLAATGRTPGNRKLSRNPIGG